MFSMRALECLVAIVEQGSLTQAAAVLAAEPFVHYNPDNGFAVWIDQFAAARGVVLPQPALRTGFPRTAAQLAAAGMGVTIVPFSALTPLPGATIRPLDPPELRDVVVIVAAPHDDLLRRFVADLKRRGLPDSRMQGLCPLGSSIRPRLRGATRPPRRDPPTGGRCPPMIRAPRRY